MGNLRKKNNQHLEGLEGHGIPKQKNNHKDHEEKRDLFLVNGVWHAQFHNLDHYLSQSLENRIQFTFVILVFCLCGTPVTALNLANRSKHVSTNPYRYSWPFTDSWMYFCRGRS